MYLSYNMQCAAKASCLKMSAKSLLLLVTVVSSALCSDSNCYDHQRVDYQSQFTPTECTKSCSVTPFFSPDHSLDTYMDLIDSAMQSIDIYTPGFDSWSVCTHYAKECDGQCIGCTVPEQRNESFPIFPALLNAMSQRNITVRLLTNNYSQPTCQGSITPLDWLYLNGAQIKYYQTTTFMHSKYVVIDKGKRTSVSSVNFSKTSFTKNREAGVVLEQCDCPTIAFYQSVFESDWATGDEYIVTNKYTKPQLETITSKSVLPYPSIPRPIVPGAYVTTLKRYDNVMVSRGYTAPDNARSTILNQLKAITTSIQVAIYQITDTGLCQQLQSLYDNGVNVSLLVSATIVSNDDWRAAQQCYCQLHQHGLKGNIRKALNKFRFAHQKYWITDNSEVHLSTGNWSPSDFPNGTVFPPHAQQNVNRDLLVTMEGQDIVTAFQTVFNNDWATGSDWEPKYCN